MFKKCVLKVAVTALEAAKRVCELSNWTITNLKLQKMLYLAHMFHLGSNGMPLINEEFEAWDYGPVVPSLYHKVKVFSDRPIRNVFNVEISNDLSEIIFLDQKYKELNDKSPWELVLMTHLKNGAWEKYYKEKMIGRSNKIVNVSILEEYRQFYDTAT